MPDTTLKTTNKAKRALTATGHFLSSHLPKTPWVRYSVLGLAALASITILTMYGIAQWYIHSERSKPYVQGVTFIPSYAEYLGVNPAQTMDALIGIDVRQFRLVSYWNQLEPEQGIYDFSTLDWQFEKAEASDSKVSLAIGLRQPRWPECHAPNWIDTKQPRDQWQPQLEAFMTRVIERYKDSPALDSYQLENEFFNHFGECYNFDRERLSDELALVKKLDPHHPVIISRSNNYAGLMLRQPLPDEIGISVYRRVWDATVTKRYLQYPFPAWYYGFLAGGEKLLTGKDSVLHELQAEPWPPRGQGILETSLAEQNKTFDAERFEDRVKFAKATGMREVYYWGAEYWYYRMTVLNDPSVWRVAETTFGHD